MDHMDCGSLHSFVGNVNVLHVPGLFSSVTQTTLSYGSSKPRSGSTLLERIRPHRLLRNAQAYAMVLPRIINIIIRAVGYSQVGQPCWFGCEEEARH